MPNNENDESIGAQQFINLVKEQIDKELVRLDQKFDEKIQRIESTVESAVSITRDHVESVEEKVNAKLDGVDEALRGNGRIGIFEQLRNLKVHLKVLTVVVAALVGAKVFFGLGMDEAIKNIFSKPTVNHVEQKKPATQPATINP